MDSLLNENAGIERGRHQPQLRTKPSELPSGKSNTPEVEQESSVCGDVDKDPMMIEQLKKERTKKYDVLRASSLTIKHIRVVLTLSGKKLRKGRSIQKVNRQR